MPLLYGFSATTDGYILRAFGYHLWEDLSGSGELDVRNQIYNDYDAAITPSITGVPLSAVYAPITFVTVYSEETTKIFGGNPPRYKFGSLTTKHQNIYGELEYITYLQQGYEKRTVLVNPSQIDFPPDMSALPTYEGFTFFFLSSQITGATGAIALPSRLLSSTHICYDLEPAVTATIGIAYVCYFNSPGNLPSSFVTAAL